MSRLFLWLMCALACVPLPALRALGAALGLLMYALAGRRRRVALTNLRLCFPEWSEAERRRVARRNFICFVQAFLDRAWLWSAPPEVVRRRITLTGEVDELRRPEAAIMFAPHFYGMDAGGAGVVQQALRQSGSIYSPQKSAVLDAWMRAGRERFGDVVMVNRRDGIRPVIKWLRGGRYLYLLPDMDLGAQDSVFVPFFGVPCATVTALPRLARMGRARVVSCITRMTSQGYETRVSAPWLDYPSGDDTADAARMNSALEAEIRTMPEQYYWVHRRFKTRPPGEPAQY